MSCYRDVKIHRKHPKMLCSHFNLILDLLISYSPGRPLSSLSHIFWRAIVLGLVDPMIGRPSMRSLSNIATSSNVTVHSPQRRWNVCVSSLYRSTNALIRGLFICIWQICATRSRPVCHKYLRISALGSVVYKWQSCNGLLTCYKQ